MRGIAATTVEEYLDQVPREDFRHALEKLRALLREELPDATEVISYGMPAFRLSKVIVYYAAFKNHCSFFAGSITEQFLSQLQDFKTSKGTIQFTPSHPIPDELIRKIVKARLADLNLQGSNPSSSRLP